MINNCNLSWSILLNASSKIKTSGSLNNEVEDFKEDYESIYLEIIQEACKQLDIHDDLELSVIFVDDQRIHEINKEYRKIDRSTDVISFALEDSEQYYIEGMPREIGDIFISIDHAKMQAEEYGPYYFLSIFKAFNISFCLENITFSSSSFIWSNPSKCNKPCVNKKHISR